MVGTCTRVQGTEKGDAMITERFTQLFSRLLGRWLQYQDAPRDPERVTERAAARVALDEVRSEIEHEHALCSVAPAPHLSAPRVAVSDSDLRKLRVAAIGFDGTA